MLFAAQLLDALGENDRALKLLRKALEKDPEFVDAKDALRRLKNKPAAEQKGGAKKAAPKKEAPEEAEEAEEPKPKPKKAAPKKAAGAKKAAKPTAAPKKKARTPGTKRGQ